MSSKLNLGIRCYAYMCVGTAWEMLTQLKADMVFADNTVWSTFERSEASLSLIVALYKISTSTSFNFNLISSFVTSTTLANQQLAGR